MVQNTSAKAWPKGAKMAVMVTIMLESWPDGKAPPYSPMASPLKEGTIDRQGIAWAQYGGKTGIWRLMRILKDFGIPATVCANARSVELYPEAIRALIAEGHAVAGHGYTQNQFMVYMEPEEEKALIHKCLGIIKDISGQKAAGWASPRMTATEHTAGFLAQEGCLWHGDYHDIDMPEIVTTPRGEIVALPHSEFTDNRVMRGNPRDYLNVYEDMSNFLYERESPCLLNVTLHAHFGGRPPMSAVFVEILKHLKKFDSVWYARHDEVAQWTRDQAK